MNFLGNYITYIIPIYLIYMSDLKNKMRDNHLIPVLQIKSEIMTLFQW